MVDDAIDRKFDKPRDYWYANARLARTGPEIHAYADQWADLRGYSIWGNQRTRVLLNHGGYFKDAATTAGLGKLGNARGAALADFDNDGDLDLIQTHQFASASYFENVGEPKNDWISIGLSGNGTTTSRDAIGARVRIGESTQWLTNISGFAAQQGHRLHFATRENTEIEVLWPDGGTSTHSAAPNQHLQIRQLPREKHATR
jgi:hypothetical protein